MPKTPLFLSKDEASDLYDALDEAADSLQNFLNIDGTLSVVEAKVYQDKIERWSTLRTQVGALCTIEGA